MEQLVARIRQDGLKKVLLVSDANLVNLGLIDELKGKIKEEGIEFVLFDVVQPNPTIQNAENARTLYLSEKCGGVVLVGGGIIADYKTPEEGAAAMIAKIREFNQNMAIPAFIAELREIDIPLLVQRVTSEGNPAYPVPKIFY